MGRTRRALPADDSLGNASIHKRRRDAQLPVAQPMQADLAEQPQPAAEASDTEQMDVDAEGDDENVAVPAPNVNNRREVMASIARKRAAHFANFQADDDDDEDGIGLAGGLAGGAANNDGGGDGCVGARSLGPWSSARQLEDQRADAQERRRTKLAAAEAAAAAACGAPVAAAGAAGAGASNKPSWVPTRDLALGRRPEDRVPRLRELCVRLLVDNIQDVETLWGLPDSIKVMIADAVCKRRCLTPQVVHLFTEGCPSEVCLSNCTALATEDLVPHLRQALTPSLQRLSLVYAGRALSDEAVMSLAGDGQEEYEGGGDRPLTQQTLANLEELHLCGAYRLTDRGLGSLLSRCPALRELRVPLCPNVTGASLERLPRLAPDLRVLDLHQCRAVSAESLLAALRGLPLLERLVLNGLHEVTDGVLSEAACALPALAQLDICQCSCVTDQGVASLTAAAPQLQALRADDVTKLTDAALRSLAEHCRGLQVLSLGRCSRITDEGVAEVASCCSLRELTVNGVPRVGSQALTALASFCRERLEVLDVSWCRGVTDAPLGLLADSCATLQRLVVWGCSQLTESFLLGHSNNQLQVVGRGEALVPVTLP